MRRLAILLIGMAVAAGASAQPPAAPGPDAGGPAYGPQRKPAPVFDNPHTDPRDFEGLWLPGRAVQSLSPITASTPRPKPGPGEDVGPLKGPIIGMAATNEQMGSTLQCTPTWRLIGAGGGMSNYWIMGKKQIILYAEEDMDVARKIYLGATHPAGLVPQPNGHSIGHWEGDVLVVDTVGFSRTDGNLADRRVVERIEKKGGTLMDHAVVQDAGRTIYVDLPSTWRPDYTVSENVCEEGFRRYELHDGQVVILNTLPDASK